LPAQRIDVGLWRRLAEHRLRRIARNEVNQRKHEGDHAEQDWNRQRETADHEAQHRVILF
jgi:hypothetical protein